MSDTKSKLNSVATRIREGLGKLNNEAKAKAAAKQSPAPVEDLDLDKEFDQPPPPAAGERLSARSADDGEIEDAFIIEGESEPAKPKKRGLDTKQKILVVVAAVAVALWYSKNQSDSTVQVPTAPEEQHLEGFQSEDSASTNVAGPVFEMDDSSNSPIEAAGGSDDMLGFGGSGPKDAANSPLGTDALTADLNQQFSGTAEESNEVLDPFTGKVNTVAAHPADLPVPESHENAPSAMLPEADLTTGSAKGNLAMIGTPGDSPFGGADSNSTELSGTKNQNPDSKKGVLQDQSANADVIALKAKAAEKDSRIGSLETEVGNLKKELATAKHDLKTANQGPAKSSPSKVTQHKPVKAVHTTQRSTPSQRVASAPKAVPRPQICVTAVAQAARNCTTCVPHAFITHRGTETMVGQGDFLEGLRVNIVGDRLDLQNANGDVVHKFWSSPNGCAAG